jgi:hypothetical protein
MREVQNPDGSLRRRHVLSCSDDSDDSDEDNDSYEDDENIAEDLQSDKGEDEEKEQSMTELKEDGKASVKSVLEISI